MTKKIIPVGTEDFAKVRRENMYYVDKTGLIKDLFSISRDVTLFTRPRRFGKTLNMSMLRYFFEIGTDKSLFEGLEISKDTELCEKHMGQYPVIFISLKDVKGETFETACEGLRWVIMKEAERLHFLANSDKLSKTNKQWYDSLLNGTAPLERMLDNLAVLLHKHYGKKVVILIDEYDVPLSNAEQKGFYEDMRTKISAFLSSALKTSDNYVEFAVVTGCLRVVKESIFTGLNKFYVNTIADVKFDEWFGFTDKEVQEMLDYYGISEHYETTKHWYDGYRFGDQDVYNPWDVTNWCKDLVADKNAAPQNYWANTSSNDIIRQFAEIADDEIRLQLGRLIDGETIVKPISMELNYHNIYQNTDNLWSLLYAAGYLTGRRIIENGAYQLVIPNNQVRLIYMNTIETWFKEKTMESADDIQELIESFAKADVESITENLDVIMSDCISYHDCKEGFYHGLLLGMLKSNGKWDVLSNREAGDGRFDIAVKAKRRTRADFGFIIEVKHTSKKSLLEKKAQEALSQIEEQRYEEYFAKNDRSKIAKYGIAFSGKECFVIKKMPTE